MALGICEEILMETDDYVCVPPGSLCENCIYAVFRLIEPLDEGAYELYLFDENNDDGIFAHACCMVLDIDLHDHIVKGCNKFDDGYDNSDNPFANNKFLRG